MALALSLAQPGYTQSFVRLMDNNKTPNSANPIDSTHGLPVNLVGGTGASVAVTSTVTPTGTSLANATSVTASTPAIDTTITLTAASSNVTITNQTDSDLLYLSLNGTATTSNYCIPVGGSYTYTGVPAIASFHVIGGSAKGHFSYISH